MKLIELHILQSYPVSCLNRDDVGSPKSAVFGGVTRSRISSQCLKRSTRLFAREEAPNFKGIRTRYLKARFRDALLQAGIEEEKADLQAEELCGLFSKTDSKNKEKVTTAVYLSPGEIEQIANQLAQDVPPKKAIKSVQRLDAADIALFGRMVANDPSLNIEGAAMFSHALTTHKSANEVDFYTAVDDANPNEEDAGAGMMGTLEYSSGTFYRYAAINLDLLFDERHLAALDPEDRKAVVECFIKSVLMSLPNARQNSMNAHTLPFEVLAVFKESGQPIQLVNAFEKPISPSHGGGLAEASRTAMQEELEKLKTTWDIQHVEELWLTEKGLSGILEGLRNHVA